MTYQLVEYIKDLMGYAVWMFIWMVLAYTIIRGISDKTK